MWAKRQPTRSPAGHGSAVTPGEPIPKAEMDEYGDNILIKLEPLLTPDMRVLEIGCASGISMYRLAPKVGLYYGTDLSPVIIRKNEERNKRENHGNIKLAAMPADNIHMVGSDERGFDLVIVNSVLQCFHGHNYLRDVINKARQSHGVNGVIFSWATLWTRTKKRISSANLRNSKARTKATGIPTKTDWSVRIILIPRLLRRPAQRYAGNGFH